MRRLVGEPVDGLFDFRTTTSFASAYIDTYYRDKPPTNDERRVFEFLVRHTSRAPATGAHARSGVRAHRASRAAVCPFGGRDSRRGLPARRILRRSTSGRWEHPTRVAGTTTRSWCSSSRAVPFRPGDVGALEALAKAKVTRLLTCDLTQHHVLGRDAWYPLVSAFYCTEEVGISLARWEEVMANLARVVAPGGRLFLVVSRRHRFLSRRRLELPLRARDRPRPRAGAAGRSAST